MYKEGSVETRPTATIVLFHLGEPPIFPLLASYWRHQVSSLTTRQKVFCWTSRVLII